MSLGSSRTADLVVSFSLIAAAFEAPAFPYRACSSLLHLVQFVPPCRVPGRMITLLHLPVAPRAGCRKFYHVVAHAEVDVVDHLHKEAAKTSALRKKVALHAIIGHDTT